MSVAVVAHGATDDKLLTLTGWAPVAAVAAVLVVYLAGAASLARRGDAWPASRTVMAVAGCAAAAVAVAPAVAGREGFTAHVGQHLLLALLTPLLLSRSAPVTLVLRLARPRPRRTLLRLLHSSPVRALTWPGTVVALDVGTLAALYLTPLYALAERSAPVHAAVHLHMVATGCLLAWWLVGLDPVPGRLGTRGRFAVLLATAVAHDVLAKHLYATAPPALGAADDVRRGAQLMFYGGEVVEVLTAVALMADWYARGGRSLARARARSDRLTAS